MYRHVRTDYFLESRQGLKSPSSRTKKERESGTAVSWDQMQGCWVNCLKLQNRMKQQKNTLSCIIKMRQVWPALTFSWSSGCLEIDLENEPLWVWAISWSQKHRAGIWRREDLSWMSGGSSLLWEWWGAGTAAQRGCGCPVHPWRCSRPGWMWPWAAWSSIKWGGRWLCMWQGGWSFVILEFPSNPGHSMILQSWNSELFELQFPLQSWHTVIHLALSSKLSSISSGFNLAGAVYKGISGVRTKKPQGSDAWHEAESFAHHQVQDPRAKNKQDHTKCQQIWFSLLQDRCMQQGKRRGCGGVWS